MIRFDSTTTYSTERNEFHSYNNIIVNCIKFEVQYSTFTLMLTWPDPPSYLIEQFLGKRNGNMPQCKNTPIMQARKARKWCDSLNQVLSTFQGTLGVMG